MREQAVEAKLVRWCRDNGVYTRKFTSPARRGVPDRVLIRGGHVLFLELKAEGNHPTMLQLHEINELRKHGAHAEWASGWENTLSILVTVFPAYL